jgi:hypothetical protein
METTVSAMATYPIALDFLLSCLRYFQAYQSPNGARKKLIRYMIVCFKTDVEGIIGPSRLPQLGQKLADEGDDASQAEQTIPTCVSIVLLIFELSEAIHHFLPRSGNQTAFVHIVYLPPEFIHRHGECKASLGQLPGALPGQSAPACSELSVTVG